MTVQARGETRRDIFATLGVVAAGGGILSSSDATDAIGQGRDSGILSVIDYGARGDGRSDDTSAFERALSLAEGANVVAPPRSAGYVFERPLVVPPRASVIFLAGGNQIVRRRHMQTMFRLESGARVQGGDFRGGGGRGSCFAFPGGSGQQVLSDVVAVDGWRDPILDFAADGGSQSRVENFSFYVASGSGSFAVRIADATAPAAVPRQFSRGEFNGGPSFDFGGCSIVMIDGVYCADIRFSPESRGVMISRSRVGNQRELTIRGYDHILEAGWMPRVRLARGTDNCVVSGFFNSGIVFDESGNGRNAVTYVAQQVPVRLSGDNGALAGARPVLATLSRTGSLYALQFAGEIDGAQLGQRLLYIDLPAGAATSCPVDQWGNGAIVMAGSSQYDPVSLRILPVDAGRAAIMVYRGGAPLSGTAVGGGKFRISGSINYSA